MDKAMIGILGNVQNAMGLLGALLYSRYCVGVPTRRMVFWGLLAQQLVLSCFVLVFTGVTAELGMPNDLFCILITGLSGVLATMSFTPILGTVALLAPKGMEATVFCIFTSASNFGILLSGQLACWMTEAFGITETDFSHLTSLMVTCRLLKCLPCLLVFLLPTDEEVQLRFKKKDLQQDQGQTEGEREGERAEEVLLPDEMWPIDLVDGHDPVCIEGQKNQNFLPTGQGETAQSWRTVRTPVRCMAAFTAGPSATGNASFIDQSLTE